MVAPAYPRCARTLVKAAVISARRAGRFVGLPISWLYNQDYRCTMSNMSAASWALCATVVALVLLAWLGRASARRRRAEASPDIVADAEMLWLTGTIGGSLPLRWNEVVRITLEWSENPWGDPQFGAYCDSRWVMHSGNGRSLSIDDSSANRAVLFENASKRLPGFDSDRRTLEGDHWDRCFDLGGGSLVVWSRAP
jgi:hypothetical protein